MSKASNYFSRLDLDSFYLMKAREFMGDDALVTATVKVTLPGGKMKVDSKFIMQRFERMDEIKYDATLEKDYLARFGGFDTEFIDFIYATKFPEISFEDGNFRLFGTKASVYLSYCALRNLLTEHLHENFLDEELIVEDMVINEGIRKLMVKCDMVRGSDFPFIEAGTAIRYSYAWQATVFNTIVADLKPNLVGTTSPIFGMLYGVPLYTRKGEAVRPIIDSLKDGQEVDGSIYEMLHCYIHRGGRNSYLWSDLMSDVVNLGFDIELVV